MAVSVIDNSHETEKGVLVSNDTVDIQENHHAPVTLLVEVYWVSEQKVLVNSSCTFS